ncbi:hypothetical protein ACFU9B_42310 [Streptomyces sp. NPDC057592]|uniref:hypothetical protein n=1 Tax=unclassified Streptomyces TaxID=2593676 RepID=UPI00369B5FFD
MWDHDLDGRREHEGLARALDDTGAPDGRIWNGHRWQEWDAWTETGSVTHPLRAGGPAALRAECQCVWHGPTRPLDSDPSVTAATVEEDWEQHIAAATVAVPPRDVEEEISDLLLRLFALAEDRPLAALGALCDLEGKIEPQRVVAVGRARRQGDSWQKVADALGVARQSAWEKYQFAGTGTDVTAAYAKAEPPTS